MSSLFRAMFTEPVTVKVVMVLESHEEIRVFQATPGTSSKRLVLACGTTWPAHTTDIFSSCLHSGFAAFMTEVASRFGCDTIESTLAYTDHDGDVVTVSTDSEFEAALKSGTTRFEAFPNAGGRHPKPKPTPTPVPPGDVTWSGTLGMLFATRIP